MKKLIVLLLCLFAVACNSCTPQPSPLPPPAPAPAPPVVVVDAGPSPLPMGGASPVVDAGPQSPEAIACAKLAALHCAEGMPGCELALQRLQKLTVVPLGCLTDAESKGAVRACGAAVACP